MSDEELMVVSCPTCNQRFRVRVQSAGRAVKCPHCAAAVSVPHASSPAASQGAQEGFQLGPPKNQPPPQPAAAPHSPTRPFSAAGATPLPDPATSADQPHVTAVPAGVQTNIDPAAAGQPPSQMASRSAAQNQAGTSDPYAKRTDPNPFSPSPSLELSTGTISGLPVRRRYPALQIIRVIYLVLAGLVAVGWALFMGFTLVLAAQAGAVVPWFFASLVPTGASAMTATMLVAIAEGIKLVLDIQSNTLVTARATAGRSS